MGYIIYATYNAFASTWRDLIIGGMGPSRAAQLFDITGIGVLY